MFPIIGDLISAGASLFGAKMNADEQDRINQQNIAFQQQTNATNIAEQEKFAQSGVQWRVADAKAAGISPLAALGAQTGSFSNVVAPQAQSSNAFGTGVAAAGQDIGRAIAATRSPEDQAIALEKTRQDLESGQLDNELKRAQLASAVSLHTQGGGVGRMQRVSGQVSQFPKDDQGNPTQYPSRDIEGAAWIDPWAKDQYLVGHQILPMFGYNVPPQMQPPAGSHLHAYRNPFTGNYYNFPSAGDMWDYGKEIWNRGFGRR